MVRELADALHQRGRLVYMHKQVFPDRTLDRIWIPDIARRGWIIVTRDRRLQSRHLEWMSFLRAKARVLWFKGDRASNIGIMEGFLSALATIDKMTSELQLRVTPAGAVESERYSPHTRPPSGP